MGSDQFVIVISNFCMYMLPVLAVVLLVFLIISVNHIIKVMKSLNVTLIEATKTLQDCDTQVKKLDKPLHTVEELSETVDYVHQTSKKAVTSAAAVILSNIGNITEWVKEKKSKNEELNPMEKEECDSE